MHVPNLRNLCFCLRQKRVSLCFLLIGQLAVHTSCAGQGPGKITLIEALKRLAQINEHMPAYAVIVDCLDEEAEGFYQKYGFVELCRNDGRARMFLPMRTVLELFQDN